MKKQKCIAIVYMILLLSNMMPVFTDNVDAETTYGTFGNISLTSGSSRNWESVIMFGNYTMRTLTGTAAADNITLKQYIGSGVKQRIRCMIYNESYEYVGKTEEKNITGTGATVTYTFNFSSNPTLVSEAKYYLAVWVNSTTGVTAVIFTSASGNGVYALNKTYWTNGSVPASLSGFDTIDSDGNYTIYCSYTETTGGANTEPYTSGHSPVNGTVHTSLTPELSIVCTDPDGDTMNATWWMNTYTNTTIIDEDCVTWDTSKWGYTWNAPTVADGYWNFSIAPYTSKAVQAYFKTDTGYGVYTVRFKLTPQETSPYASGSNWAFFLYNGTIPYPNHQEIDMPEIYGGNAVPRQMSMSTFNSGLSGYEYWTNNASLPFWDGAWHTLKVAYTPMYIVFILDGYTIHRSSNYVRYAFGPNAPEYKGDWFGKPPMTYCIYFASSGNNHYRQTMLVDYVKITTGDCFPFAVNNSISNGTIRQTMAHADTKASAYFWSVNLSDGNGGYANDSVFFTTSRDNQPPEYSYISPVNNSINQETSLTWQLYISDSESDTFNWSIQCNNGQTNSGTVATNGTKTLSLSGLAYSTTYRVYVNATDLFGASIQRWYQFTTKDEPEEPWVNTPPTISNPSPSNNSILQPLYVPLSIYIGDADGNSTTVRWYNNKTGSWVLFQTNNTVTANTTVRVANAPFATASETKYWWRVTADDGHDGTSRTYNFKTQESESEIGNPYNIHANWTTTSNLNISWTKGAGTTHTIISRKLGSYPMSPSGEGITTVYNGTADYINLSVSPDTRYFYTAFGRNSTTIYSPGVNIITAYTDNATVTTSSSILFPGYITTDRTTTTNFHYSNSSTFSTILLNETIQGPQYTTGYDSYYEISKALNGTLLNKGQSFRTGTTRYYLYNISLNIRRNINPGTLFIYLYEANTSGPTYGLPSGTANTSGSMNANLLTPSFAWYNISLSPYYLKSNTTYCFVLSAPSASGFNWVGWATDQTSPTYTDGCAITGIGTTYTNSTRDGLFKIWGKSPESLLNYATATNTTVTSSQSYTQQGTQLNPGVIYFYRAYGTDNNGNLSLGNVRYSLTNPGVPLSVYSTYYSANNSVLINWTQGIGANQTVLINGTSITDEVLYNGSAVFFWVEYISFNAVYSLTLFSYTEGSGLHRYSTGVSVPFGGAVFNCFNESSGLPIGFSVLISNQQGDEIYYGPDLSGWQYINTTEIPMGSQIMFYITPGNNTNQTYRPRTYYYDIEPNVFYNMSFYLPPTIGDGGTTPEENTTYPYLFTIVGQQSIYGSALPIENASVIIKKYMTSTDTYTTVSSLYTDAVGQCADYLLSYQAYKLYVEKEGYYPEVVNFIADPNLRTKTITLTLIPPTPPTTKHPHEYVFLCGISSRTNTTLSLHYWDSLEETTDAQFFIYEINHSTGTETLFNTSSIYTDDSDIYYNVTDLNTLDSYRAIVYYNHTTFDAQTISCLFPGYRTTVTIPGALNNILIGIFGTPPIIWSALIMFLLAIAMFFFFDREHAGIGLMIIGGLFLFINIYLGFDDLMTTAAGGILPILLLICGVIIEYLRHKGETTT